MPDAEWRGNIRCPRPALRLACLAVDAELAEHGAEPFDLVGELLASLGQNRQCRVPGGSLLLPRGPTGQQFLLLVTHRRGPLVLLGIGGALPLEADPADLVVQFASR